MLHNTLRIAARVGVAAAAASAASAASGVGTPQVALAHHETGRKFEFDHRPCDKLEEVNWRLQRLEILMKTRKLGDRMRTLVKVRETNPDNLMAKHFPGEKYLKECSPENQERLYQICKSGLDNPDSGLGAYAMTPSDYEDFKDLFFDNVIRDYHKADPKAVHVTDWDISKVGDKGVLDVAKLGLAPLSIRVRVGRNLSDFNLPGNMDKEERIAFERTMLKAFAKLQADPEFGGEVYSLTPDFGEHGPNPNLISDEKYQELIDAHVMFKDMAADPYLASAGIASDWPYGRGCYATEKDGFKFIVWFGEEDCLRVMVMGKTTRIDHVFTRLKQLLDTIESIDGLDFATSRDYGYVTSCPTNLGTGMRASVHIPLPNLTADGTDKKAKEVCKPMGLSVRGTGGEHTPIKDNLVDISPSRRLFIKEAEIVAALYEGIEALLKEEGSSKM